MRKKKEVTVVVFSVIFFLFIPMTLAASAGPNSPGTVNNDASYGTAEWDDVSDAKISDNDRAEADLNDFETSQYLKATNFSFFIPANAIIRGITVAVERRASSTYGGSVVRDASVRLVKGGSIQGADRATTTVYTTSDTYENHGNDTDLWNGNWTPADINAPGFGVAFAATKANDNGGDREARVNHISITVSYFPDTTPPIITLIGSNQTLEVGSVYEDPGATATDDNDGSITGAIMAISTVNSSIVGSYSVTYHVNDSAGNNATAARSVTVVDTIAPVITVLGANPATVSHGAAYADAGATATDNYNGDITDAIIINNTVNTSAVGSYTITYFVNDSSGNNATATRTTNVIDTTPPVITILGTSPVTVDVGTVYTDPGAEASDNYDGNISGAIVANSTVDASSPGTYTVMYAVNDSSGNTAVPVTRNVTVIASSSYAAKHYPSLGPNAFSHFARPQGAPPPGTAFASIASALASLTASGPAAVSSASATAAGAVSSAPAGSAGEAGIGGAMTTVGVSTAAAGEENAVSGRATLGSASTITGAVTGTRKTTPWKWVAVLGALAVGLLVVVRHRRRHHLYHKRKELLRQLKTAIITRLSSSRAYLR